MIYADYLNIMYIPSSGELIVFAAAFAGALFGFLWYNCYPAQVFMGDTGSLAIGGIIAVFALLIRKELLLPLLCGIFLVEALSVLIQRGWFKLHQTQIRRRAARLPDGAHPSPLPEEGLLRIEDRRTLLDRAAVVGCHYARNA